MKKLTSLYIVFLLTMLGFQGNLKAQVSHGGRPLPLSLMRSTNGQMFKEMPPFDVQEELRIDSLNESDLRSGFRFAYKFITDYNRYNSGVTFTGRMGHVYGDSGSTRPGPFPSTCSSRNMNCPKAPSSSYIMRTRHRY